MRVGWIMRVCFAAPSMVGEVVCVFWKAVVGVFWLLCFDWFVLVNGYAKLCGFFFGFVIICLATNHQCLAIVRKILRSR